MNDAESIPKILVQICTQALWAPLTVFYLHKLAARSFGHEPYVDPVMHFFGGIAIAFFFWKSTNCCNHYLGHWTPKARAILAFSLATLVAAAWELMELLLVTYRNTSLISRNTSTELWLATLSRDLILGISGTVLFFGIYLFIASRPAK
jgi:hypothetical protein